MVRIGFLNVIVQVILIEIDTVFSSNEPYCERKKKIFHEFYKTWVIRQTFSLIEGIMCICYSE